MCAGIFASVNFVSGDMFGNEIEAALEEAALVCHLL